MHWKPGKAKKKENTQNSTKPRHYKIGCVEMGVRKKRVKGEMKFVCSYCSLKINPERWPRTPFYITQCSPFTETGCTPFAGQKCRSEYLNSPSERCNFPYVFLFLAGLIVVMPCIKCQQNGYIHSLEEPGRGPYTEREGGGFQYTKVASSVG